MINFKGTIEKNKVNFKKLISLGKVTQLFQYLNIYYVKGTEFDIKNPKVSNQHCDWEGPTR